MKVVLPIAALLAILIAAGSISGGPSLTDRGPVDPAQGSAVPYPVAFDPFTGWGMADIAVDQAPESAVIRVEIRRDLFDYYGVDTAEPFPVNAPYLPPLVPQPQSFADMRALYDPEPLMPTAADEPVAVATATNWWGDSPPPDAK